MTKEELRKEMFDKGWDLQSADEMADIIIEKLDLQRDNFIKMIEGYKGHYVENIDPPEWEKIYGAINGTIDEIIEELREIDKE